jgi:hypothetical protein
MFLHLLLEIEMDFTCNLRVVARSLLLSRSFIGVKIPLTLMKYAQDIKEKKRDLIL